METPEANPQETPNPFDLRETEGGSSRSALGKIALVALGVVLGIGVVVAVSDFGDPPGVVHEPARNTADAKAESATTSSTATTSTTSTSTSTSMSTSPTTTAPPTTAPAAYTPPVTSDPAPAAPVRKATAPPSPPTTAERSLTAGSIYYKNCTVARAAGVTPIYVGEPGYAAHLDRDKDGIACE